MITIKLASATPRRRRDRDRHPSRLPPHRDVRGPGADLDPGDAAVQIVDLVDGLSIEQSGSFLRWDGSVHPW